MMEAPGGDVLQEFTSAMSSGVVVVDDSGTVVLCNPVAHRLLGRTQAELIGAHLGFPLVPRGITDVDVVMRDGSARPVEMQVTDTIWGSEHAYVVALRDISDQMQASRELAASEERFERVFEDSPVGMAIVDADLRFLRANATLCRLLAYDVDELRRLSFDDITLPDDVAAQRQLNVQLLDGATSGYEVERQYLTKGGETRWAHISASLLDPVSDTRPHVITIVEDITERKVAHARVTHLALHDELTGLANRALAIDRLQLAQARAERSGMFVGLMFLDLDRFKEVNDSLGHDAGDALLVEVARRLESVLRPSDTAARLGGDEFVVCCENLGHDEAEAQADAIAVAQRIAAALVEPVPLEGGVARVTASIGISLVRGVRQSPDVVVRNADRAMYRAKERGRARFELFDEALQANAMERVHVADELRLALARDELVVHYQPVIDLTDGRIVGAEALVRWDHPERGLLLPGAFLEVAEESDLIVPLGDLVMKDACRQLTAWRDTFGDHLVVAVNASARQLGHHALETTVREALAETGLEPKALQIELTESVFIEAGGPTLTELNGLRDLGVHLGVDDFGTGYASLTYLRRLPVDFVKVDQSFVAGLGKSVEDHAIVHAVIDLAHALGLRVVAEGVESGAQETALRLMGCDHAQGWHVGRPEPADELTRLLAAAP